MRFWRSMGDGIDFVQLQINYADWEQPNVQSRKCLEVANKYGKPVTVMEPCKGGTLVNIPEDAEKLMKECREEKSAASWALRFAASQRGVTRVLSGMNTIEQVEDNTDTFLANTMRRCFPAISQIFCGQIQNLLSGLTISLLMKW